MTRKQKFAVMQANLGSSYEFSNSEDVLKFLSLWITNKIPNYNLEYQGRKYEQIKILRWEA